MSVIKSALNEFLRKLKDEYNEKIEKIILFGSYIRGDMKEGSDIDILVVIKKEDFLLRRRIISLSAEIMLKYGVDISPKVISKDDFNKEIEKKGIFITNILSEGEIIV